MRSSWYLILIATFLNSCSWYGSSGKIYQKEFSGGKIFMIVHEQISEQGMEYHDLLVSELMQNIWQKQLLNVQYFEQDHTVLTFKRSPYFKEYRHIAKGYLFITGQTTNNMNVVLDLALYDAELNLIITAHHNTLWGNSYFFPPTLERAVIDASKGLAQVLNRKLKKLTL